MSGHGPWCPLSIIFSFVIMDSSLMLHIPISFLQENDSQATKTLKKLHHFILKSNDQLKDNCNHLFGRYQYHSSSTFKKKIID